MAYVWALSYVCHASTLKHSSAYIDCIKSQIWNHMKTNLACIFALFASKQTPEPYCKIK